ncbi:MAG TPA: glutathione-disulfide reductase [Pseudomonadales bacterium]|nr:glutathione-disulfide reductase [Pseudomonadales bacterium]
MSAYDYDFFVIGAGSGGVRCSRMAASYGARVGIAEDRYLGGTCVNVGCVPKKLFVYASHYGEEFAASRGYGWSEVAPTFDWQRLRDNKNTEIERLNGVYGKLLEGAGVTLHDGTARLADAHTVVITAKDGKETRVTTDKVLIATGSWPHMPDVPGIEHAVNSNEMFFLENLPKRAAVVGGGYIAVEFAGILHGLGVETTLIYRGPLFLRGFDADVRAFVTHEMRAKGIELRLETDVASIEKQDDGTLRLHFANESAAGVDAEMEGETGTLDVDLALYATGRRPLVEGLGLEDVGVELTRNGAVAVNDDFQTSVDNIYALGDVIDRFQLTPVAITEGMALAKTLFAGEPTSVDYDSIPTAVFCQPNIGTVGMTEEQARERCSEIAVYESVFRAMKQTLAGGTERTMMKLIVDSATDRVVGAHMVGPEAGEIIQGIGIAMKAGATKAHFDATVGIHPTSAEEFVTMRTAVRN